MKKSVFLFLTFILILISCNKDKNAAGKINNGTWKIIELTVDGNQIVNNLPKLRIYSAEIYKKVSQGAWVINSSDTCKFYWQFSEKAKYFTISRIENLNCSTLEGVQEVDKQVYDYSGKYNVIQNKKNQSVFESYETIGFPGKKVRLAIKR